MDSARQELSKTLSVKGFSLILRVTVVTVVPQLKMAIKSKITKRYRVNNFWVVRKGLNYQKTVTTNPPEPGAERFWPPENLQF